MPLDYDSLLDFLQRGVAQIPPVVIAVILLGGPTAALIGYRLIGYRLVEVARRMQPVSVVAFEPQWVCQECRSVTELRLSRCYRCGEERDESGELELILDRPSGPPIFFDIQPGSPFAALLGKPSLGADKGPGVPVMADRAYTSDSVAVGPGSAVEADHELPAESWEARIRELAAAMERRS